jgi:hypothetical protein
LWDKLPGNIAFWDDWIKENPLSGSGHMAFNGEKKWENIDVHGTMRNGYLDGAYTLYTTETFYVCRGTPGNLEVIYTGSTASGVFETEECDFYSGEILYIIFGTVDDDETGADPIKTLCYQAVVQGEDGDSKPDYVKLGMGVFYYYPTPDEDTDLGISILDKTKTAFTSNIIDVSTDGSNKIVNAFLRITFSDANYGLIPYIDHLYDNSWYDWGILLKFTWNSSCGSAIASSIKLSASGYSTHQANIGNDKGFVIQLTNGYVFKDNDRPPCIAWHQDASGQDFPGYSATFDIPIVIDFTQCGMSADTTTDYTISGELFTWWNLPAVALSGDAVEGSYDNYDGIALTSTTVNG